MARCCVPAVIDPLWSRYELPPGVVPSERELAAAPAVIVDVDPMLLGVGGGRLVSTNESEARSSLFPTSIRLRFGEAKARASLRKGCIDRKELCDVMS